jgi:hypothetical protein
VDYDLDVNENVLEIVATHPQLCFLCNLLFLTIFCIDTNSILTPFFLLIEAKMAKNNLLARSQYHCFVCCDCDLLKYAKANMVPTWNC